MKELVDGIGGLFWRAQDPHKLAAWYAEHFGIPDIHDGGAPWQPAGGVTVFSPFPADTDYYPAAQRHMVNFRIKDLDAFCKALAAAGHPEVKPRESMDGIGDFATIADPEGNWIELWQPQAP